MQQIGNRFGPISKSRTISKAQRSPTTSRARANPLAGLPVPAVLVMLWAIVARRHWAIFAPFFQAKSALATAPAATTDRARTRSAWAA